MSALTVGAASAPLDELGATFAALQAQLQLVFPPAQFQFRVVPATLTPRVWSELTQRTPAVLLGWDGFSPQKPEMRRLAGASNWSVFAVTRNPGGPLARLIGDAKGPGLLDMVRGVAGVLNGHTFTGLGTTFVSSITQVTSAEWDMEDLAVARINIDVVGTMLASGSDLVASTTDGILQQLGITWDFAPDPLTDSPLPIGATLVPAPRIGAIRWDAWYVPGSPLTSAVTADLSPAQYQSRLPFFATIGTDGTVSIDPAKWGTGAQSVMDAEIALAAQAGLSFWAFLGHVPTAPESTALDLYLSSTLRSEVGFCLIEDLTDLWYGGAPTASFFDVAAKVTESGYVTVLGDQPLIFLLDSGAADIEARYGGNAGLAVAMYALRSAVQVACGHVPNLVILCPEPDRAATLLIDGGFDAIGAYAVPPWPITTMPYATLCESLESWWHIAADNTLPIVPPLMAGWDPSPRVTTPSALFAGESIPPQDVVTDVTPAAIAAHVQQGLAWMAAHPDVTPAGIGLLYAWNEFDEGGWIAPTWQAGQPAGDTSRIAALAGVLKGTA